MTFLKWRDHLRITQSGETADDMLQLQDASGNNLFRVDTLGNAYAKTVITNAPVTITTATYTVGAADNWLTANYAGTCTLTLPPAATYTGRMLQVRTITANTVVSASSNVVPLAGGAAGTAILAATAGKSAWLLSDGTNWQTVDGN